MQGLLWFTSLWNRVPARLLALGRTRLPLGPRIASAAGEPYAGDGWSPRLLRVKGPGVSLGIVGSLRRRHLAAIGRKEEGGGGGGREGARSRQPKRFDVEQGSAALIPNED
jgi:hypothetical protein